jgi:hypothetical protein
MMTLRQEEGMHLHGRTSNTNRPRPNIDGEILGDFYARVRRYQKAKREEWAGKECRRLKQSLMSGTADSEIARPIQDRENLATEAKAGEFPSRDDYETVFWLQRLGEY